jgi:large subunit ribosomal protein L21
MAKFAVIRTGGKQYSVEENKKLKIEKLELEDGATIEFETLLIADGDNLEIGEPTLEKKVQGKVVAQGHHKTVIGVKYKRKTRQSKKYGHRQKFTEVLIEKI